MRSKGVLLAGAVTGLALAEGLAGAQESPRGFRLRPTVGVGVGFDTRARGAGDADLFLGAASLEWMTGSERLGVRLEGLYASRERVSGARDGCGPTCDPIPGATYYFSSKVNVTGALLGLTYRLTDEGALRPYLVGGVGVTRVRDHYTEGVTIPCTAQVCAAETIGEEVRRKDVMVSGTFHAGAGLTYRLGRLQIFGEARRYLFGNDNPRALRGAMPVTLGVRF